MFAVVEALFFIVYVAVIIYAVYKAATRNRKSSSVNRQVPGHHETNINGDVKPKVTFNNPFRSQKDVTCETLYGHEHDENGHRYIVAQKAETGYVILNGVKRRISDCKDL